MSVTVRLITSDEEIARCFPVMQQLRPHLKSVEQMLALTRAMLVEGAEFAVLEHEGEVATVAAFRIRTMLVSGITMYVDDLVTAEAMRSHGHGKTMLEWLMNYARQRGCETFSLDSATFRQEAHAFYFREGMRITAFHFQSKLNV